MTLVHLRQPIAGDAAVLFPLIHGTRVTDTIAWDGPSSFEAYRRWLEDRAAQVASGEGHFRVIVELASGSAIGSASLRPEPDGTRGDFGLWIGEPYQGRGYGTEVVRLLLMEGFTALGMETIEATVMVGNLASRRIMERNAMRLDATLPGALIKRGRPVDVWRFAITRAAWQTGARPGT
jgi:RimJ/RimL family protein N-acetyltransferase